MLKDVDEDDGDERAGDSDEEIKDGKSVTDLSWLARKMPVVLTYYIS